MNVLVVWESKYGSTKEIGLEIGRELRKRGLHVTIAEAAAAYDYPEFDAYVIGSAVYAGQWMKQAKQYLRDNRRMLLAHPVWLYSSGPIGDPPKPSEAPVEVDELFEYTAPREHKVFAGRLIRSHLSLPEKAMTMLVRAPEGDFRDWDDVRVWAGRIADELKPKAPEATRSYGSTAGTAVNTG